MPLHPDKPKGFRLLRAPTRDLPEGWTDQYIATLNEMSKLDTRRPDHRKRAAELDKYLQSLEKDVRWAKRGKTVYRPAPDKDGLYPDLSSIPRVAVQRGIRANTSDKIRKQAWDQVRTSARPVILSHRTQPHRSTGLTNDQERRLMEAFAVSLPIGKGRTPGLLGSRVPGDMNLGPAGTRSIVGGKQLNTEDWNRGFTVRKFMLTNRPVQYMKVLPGLKKAVRIHEKAAGIKPRSAFSKGLIDGGIRKGLIKDTAQEFGEHPTSILGGVVAGTVGLAGLGGAAGFHRKRLEQQGKKKRPSVGGLYVRAFVPGYIPGRMVASELMPRKYAMPKLFKRLRPRTGAQIRDPKFRRAIIAKVTGNREFARKNVSIDSMAGLGSNYNPMTEHMNIAKNPGIAAHEATHRLQHQKLGKAMAPLYAGAPAIGNAIAAEESIRAGIKDDPNKPSNKMKRGIKAAAISQLPKLAMEGHANWRALPYPRGGRTTAVSMGSYLVGTAAQSLASVTPGYVIRGLRRSKLARQEAKKKKYALSPRMAKLADHAIGAGIGIVGAHLVEPFVSAPGFNAGFRRGKKPHNLTPAQLTMRRAMPGYEEGYVAGRVSGHKVGPVTFAAQHYESAAELKQINRLVRTVGTMGTTAGAAHVMKQQPDNQTIRVRKSDAVRSGQEMIGSSLQTVGKVGREWGVPVSLIPAGLSIQKAISDDRLRDLASKSFAKRLAIPVGVALTSQGISSVGRRLKERAERKTKDVAAYEAGFQYGIREHWDSLKKKVKGEIWPTMVRGAFVGGLGKAHQEIGLPPTTVDGIPVTRRSMNKGYEPYTNWQLENARRNLQIELDNIPDKNGANAQNLKQMVGDLTKEITMRQSLPSV